MKNVNVHFYVKLKLKNKTNIFEISSHLIDIFRRNE